MRPDIFLAMLEFIYTGKMCSKESTLSFDDDTGLKDIIRPDLVVDLLMASDRFLLDDLKQVCEAEIENSLELENVAAVLELSDSANAPRLKRACTEFITKTWLSFEPSTAMQELKETSPLLLEEVLAAVYAEQKEDDNELYESDDEEDASLGDGLGEDDKGKEKENEKEIEPDPAVSLVNQDRRMPPPLVSDD